MMVLEWEKVPAQVGQRRMRYSEWVLLDAAALLSLLTIAQVRSGRNRVKKPKN